MSNPTDPFHVDRAVVELWDERAQTKVVFQIIPERDRTELEGEWTVTTDALEIPSNDVFLTYGPGDKHIVMRILGRLGRAQ